MNIDTGKFKAICAAVGAEDETADAVIKAVEKQKHELNKLQIFIRALKGALVAAAEYLPGDIWEAMERSRAKS